MSGPPHRLIAILLTTALAACAPTKAPETWKPLAAPAPFSASAVCTLTLGSRELRASGGCAADPAQGARVELRDPFGVTLLLIVVTPAHAALLSPKGGLVYTWTEAGPEMPWSPSDLMALFTGPPPGSERAAPAGGATVFRWKNREGRVTAEFVPASGSAAPFSESRLKGPLRASLTLRLESVSGQTFGPEVFRVPEGLRTEPATPAAILKEAAP